MGNINTRTGETFYTIPNGVHVRGHWQDMTGDEAKLYGALYYLGCRYSKHELELSNADIEACAGLPPRAVKKAREGLCKRNLIKVRTITRDRLSRRVYLLCNSSTGEPIPSFYVQKKLRDIVLEEGFSGENDRFGAELGIGNPQRLSGRKSVFALPTELYLKYFEHRSTQQLSAASKTGWVSMRCPFHDDTHPSAGFHAETGNWNCRASDCSLHGNIVQFEQRFSTCEFSQAISNISAIVGVDLTTRARNKERYEKLVQSTQYDYRDKYGIVLYSVFRYPDKSGFPVFHRVNDRLKPGFPDYRRVIYNLPEVLSANTICVVEGEKDATTIESLGLRDSDGSLIAATTNVQGAGKWREQYSKVLRGKRVVILADRDQVGREHAEQVAKSLSPFASEVRVIHFIEQEVEDHGDATEFLESHSVADLITKMGSDWFQLPANGQNGDASPAVSNPAVVAMLDSYNKHHRL
jgi:5S rRNA maturation endonuclease (ribonuclease M5)